MAYGNDLGHWGEDIAVEYMTGNGWYLRHRNWCYDGIEIDQVYIDEEDSILVFVEVKTRSTDMYGNPSEAVDAEKRRRIVHAVAAYLTAFKKENREVRYDIISIIGTPDTQHTIRHIEDAFTMLDPYEDFSVSRRYRI